MGFKLWFKLGYPRLYTQICLEWPWARLARTDFAQALAWCGAQKSFCFDREVIWEESACAKKWEKMGLKFGVKLGHPW